MLGNYYYHQIIRKTIIAFGNLFNQIYIKHKDGDDEVFSELRVPLTYGPTQKFLARLESIIAFLCLMQSITAASCKLFGKEIQTMSTLGWAIASSITVV